MKVVLDTNVLVSETFWTGDSFQIIRKIDTKEIILILSKELIEEYDETIHSEEIIEKIENKNLVISEVIKRVLENATIVSPIKKFDIVKEDIDDNKILECAFEGKADFIMSINLKPHHQELLFLNALKLQSNFLVFRMWS